MGIAYVPDFVVREAMDEGQLQEVLPGCCIKDGIFGPVARQPLSVTANTLFYRFYGCGRDTLVTRIGTPPLVSNNLR